MAVLKVKVNGEWQEIPAIVGPAGPQGIPGAQGDPGEQGIQGEAGKGIFSFEKTGTSGLTDTYRMTYTDGSWIDMQVSNGKGIRTIAKTGTSGNVDTYTITFNDNTTMTFTVTNANIDDTAGAGVTNKTWSANKLSQQSAEVDDLKSTLQGMSTATQADLGKALIVQEVDNGKVTEWDFGEAGGGLSATAANLLLTILDEGVYGTDQSENIELLRKALLDIEPVSISAVLDSTPYVGLYYSDLKFIVTATFDDASTLVVDNYRVVTLGTVTSGNNTVTVRFRFTTCEVTFTASTVQTYTITNNLTDVSTSNPAYLTEAGERYAAELSLPDADHYISAYSVTMGGTDITSTAYNNGSIVIEEVTGNVVITVTASEYTYMPDLILQRPYVAEGYSQMRYYSDAYQTRITTRAYYGVGRISEYPAKYDCSLMWMITNDSESTMQLDGIGLGSVKAEDAPSGNIIDVAYWQNIDNTQHALQPGQSLSGTYTLKAGFQLYLTATVTNESAIAIRIRGDYVAETFDDYTLLYTITNSPSEYPRIDSYKSRTYYSDNGVTEIASVSGFPYKIATGLGPFDYDVILRTKYDSAISKTSGGAIGAVCACMSDPSETSINYASNSGPAMNVLNMWKHGVLKAITNNMMLLSTNIPNTDSVALEIYGKEVGT